MSKTCPGENRAHLRCSLRCLLDNSWCHYLVTYTHEHHGHSSCYINFFPSSEPTKSLSYQSGSSFFIFFYVHKPFCLPTHHLSPTEGFHPEDLLVPNNILLILQALIKKYCFLFFFSGRSTRAYKVAGLTLLACVLIVGQTMTAYFLLSQKNDIKSLEDQNNKLESQVSRVNSGENAMLGISRMQQKKLYLKQTA